MIPNESSKKVTSSYSKRNYNSLDRWISYFYQMNLLLDLPDIDNKKILEIGVGNKFVCQNLRTLALNIKTCDINKKLNPDYVADIRKLPFKDDEFDVILCYEVLEHVPFKQFKNALSELWRVTSLYVIISVPYSGFCFSGYLKPPFYKGFIFRLPIPIIRPEKIVKECKLDHYWTLGELHSNLRKIRIFLKQAGFSIIKEKIPILNSHHQFWVLKKTVKKQ